MPQDTNKNKDPNAESINEIIDKNFNYGDLLYTYWQFVEMFHVKPTSWFDIFEFMDYSKTKCAILDFQKMLAQMEEASKK